MFLDKKHKLYVWISLDVEEEGLFSGHYASRNTTTRNVAFLRELAPITTEMALPLTLFCSYSVFASTKACKILESMKCEHGAEIGAHLHHWSTPPYVPEDESGHNPRRTHMVPRELLLSRLEKLLCTGEEILGSPITSFRMGRWDLKATLLPLLAELGILVDSSICPLRAFQNGADHFLAPADPYWQELPEGKNILEAPITQIEILRGLAPIWHKIATHNNYLDLFHFFGAISANPLWHKDWAMRLAAKLHVKRGGHVLGFFLHSSELMPGGSPHIPDKSSSKALLKRICDFCAWLHETFAVEGVTASRLADIIPYRSNNLQNNNQQSTRGDYFFHMPD